MNPKEPGVVENFIEGNILIVDDTLVNLRLLSQMLVQRGHKVRAVSSGAQALRTVHSAPPDLILLDVMMPEMDGYEVCERLKAHEGTRDIPIIFISVLDQPQDKVKALAIGGVDYITKPFQVEEVTARVETHLRLRSLYKSLEEKNAQLQKEITERMGIEEILRRRTLEVEARNAELDAFAHTVAHDLKGPLTRLVGYTSLLEERFTEMSEEVLQHNLHLVGQTGHKMANIIDELLLLASVREMNEIEMHALDMARLIAEAQKRLTHMIEEHQAAINLPPAESWPSAWGYGPWIEEVWINYLSNAIKYGGRPPRVELGATPQEDGQVRYWVRDNGPGLTSEEQARLFTPFERLRRVPASGYGLGLSIVKRIVEKFGGRVGVESQVEGGSTFFFTLPALK